MVCKNGGIYCNSGTDDRHIEWCVKMTESIPDSGTDDTHAVAV